MQWEQDRQYPGAPQWDCGSQDGSGLQTQRGLPHGKARNRGLANAGQEQIEAKEEAEHLPDFRGGYGESGEANPHRGYPAALSREVATQGYGIL